MQVNGYTNNINANYRTPESNNIHKKHCNCESQGKQPRVDTFEKSKPEDAKYINYTDAHNHYAQAINAGLYNLKHEPMTPNDELEIEAHKEKHSTVEKSGESCPTHNNESHSYNQQESDNSNAGSTDSKANNNDEN